MIDRRTHTEILQVTAHDMATTRRRDPFEEDRYFWGELRDPKGTYRLNLNESTPPS